MCDWARVCLLLGTTGELREVHRRGIATLKSLMILQVPPAALSRVFVVQSSFIGGSIKFRPSQDQLTASTSTDSSGAYIVDHLAGSNGFLHPVQDYKTGDCGRGSLPTLLTDDPTSVALVSVPALPATTRFFQSNRTPARELRQAAERLEGGVSLRMVVMVQEDEEDPALVSLFPRRRWEYPSSPSFPRARAGLEAVAKRGRNAQDTQSFDWSK